MRYTLTAIALCAVSSACFGACDIKVGHDTIRPISVAVHDRARNLRTIANGYSDPQEKMWLNGVADSVIDVAIEIRHLLDLIALRDGITGQGNQRLVIDVLRDALASASESAAIQEDYLLKVSAMTSNQAVVSEIAGAMFTFESVIRLGDSCRKSG